MLAIIEILFEALRLITFQPARRKSCMHPTAPRVLSDAQRSL
ncbi:MULTISPECIES: hypothetical protein [unclassified Ensifer]|nr:MULTISPECIES: hypothetical protein [unclassified Ensifer]